MRERCNVRLDVRMLCRSPGGATAEVLMFAQMWSYGAAGCSLCLHAVSAWQAWLAIDWQSSLLSSTYSSSSFAGPICWGAWPWTRVFPAEEECSCLTRPVADFNARALSAPCWRGRACACGGCFCRWRFVELGVFACCETSGSCADCCFGCLPSGRTAVDFRGWGELLAPRLLGGSDFDRDGFHRERERELDPSFGESAEEVVRGGFSSADIEL
mmetsp:Transcript_52782/g.115145  ORF Transcript_52782/g.115145 Transcript_52782/m.115145 type:complete len:214 (+) Transcript_52782:94-735(+)